MSANICNICGANLIYKDGKWVCPACGAYRTEEISNEEVTLLYNAAQKLRLASFDDAEEAYRDIIAKYPENSEAHWGLVLSKYGIKYEDDYDGKKLPTCYATSIESVLTDKDYLDAVRLCKDKYQKENYIEQGKILEKIRIEWLEKASKEPKYDIFLCFKDSDKLNNMVRTDDSIEVANLYTHLSSLGYKVFYSSESLRDKVAEKYEPYIYNALNTATTMIVYGSKIEYFSSVWMKNEWTRYVRRLREGLKIEGSLIIACEGVNPSDLPRPLNQMQVLDARKKTFYGDLEAHIAKIISIARRPKATVERVEISSAIGKKKVSIDNQIKTIKVGGGVGKKTPVVIDNAVSVREIGRYEVPALTPDEDTKLKSVNLFLQKELFDNAQKVVDEILEKNKYNGQALLADLLIRYRVKNIDELSDKVGEIEDFTQFNTVIEYNDKEVGEKLIAIIGQKIRLEVANSRYNVAIDCLKKIVIYNSDEVFGIRTELRKTSAKLLTVAPKISAEIFDILLNSYQDSETYIDYIQSFVDDCIKNKQFSIAQKYNERIIELDDGNLKATFAQAYIYVQATSFDNFVSLADKFVDFKLFDNALKHFDENSTTECFNSFRKIVARLILRQKSGNAIVDWFDFIVKYEFAGRDEFIEETMNSLPNLKDLADRAKVFDHVIKCIDGNDIERHIASRLSFAAKLLAAENYTLANKYYKEALDIEEGNLAALWGVILCNIGAARKPDIANKIENFSYFTELETLLRYCPNVGIRTEYLDKLVNAVLFKSATICDEVSINKLSKVFDGIIKYYPEECNEILIKHLQKFADNCKNSSAFSLAEKYYAMVLAIDNMKHEAYWGLLQAKLNCRNNDDLIKQKKTISEFSEFSSAIAAASNDERSADKYASIAKNQIDYWENQHKKEVAKKRKNKKIAIFSSITAAVLVIVIALVGVFKYINIEKNFKFVENESGYTINVGKYYKESNVEIPATYNGKLVTKISDGMFENDTNITTITLPSNITHIGNNAFKNCTNLKRIIFKSARTYGSVAVDTQGDNYEINTGALASGNNDPNNNVTFIGEGAFYNCLALESIDVSSATSIGKEAFYGCSKLESASLNDNLAKLADGAFNGCLKLNNMQLPSALTEIGANCFVNCKTLENIVIPATTNKVGANILNGCTGLKKIVLEDRDKDLSGFDKDWKSGIPETVELKIGFRISLDYNGATSGNKTKTSIVCVGERYMLPVPERVGYKFIGWYDGIKDANKITDEYGNSVGVYEKYESVSAHAIWEANLNEIVFNSNGGEGEMDNQKIATDATVALNECLYTKKGYTFAGWGTTANGEVNHSDKADYMMGTNAQYILYAIWTPNDNTLHFESNGGSGKMSDITIATDAKETLPANAFTKIGYDFVGWAETENGSKVYSDGDSYTMGTENATLYALWTPKTYEITYNLEGGQLAVKNKPNYNIETATFNLNNPIKRGYEFKGWSGSTLAGNANQNVSVKTGTYGELTFTANWKVIEYPIVYHLNGGTNSIVNPETYTIEQEVRLQDPERKGYKFSRWTDNGLISKGSIGEKTFTANWKVIEYPIVYHLNGETNSNPNPKTYTIEQEINLQAPERKGYDFTGWSDNGLISKGSVGEKTFTANWKVIEYPIVYHLNGGTNSIVNPETYTIEQEVRLQDPERKGYKFSGWTDNGLISKGSVGEKTFTASWEIINYDIIYNLDGGINNSLNPNDYNINTPDIVLNAPTKLGYKFIGWSDNGTIVSGSIGEKTFTANWEIENYTISYNLDGGINNNNNPSTYNVNDSITLAEPTKTGYRFIGWSDNGVISKGSIGEKTFTASWEIIEYKITYVLNGGTNSELNKDYYNVENEEIILAAPTRAGYTFNGWTNEGRIPAQSTGDKEFVASWTANQNTLKFNANGGNGGEMPDVTLSTDEEYKLPKNALTRYGYTFAGWSTKADGTVEFEDESVYTMGADSEVTLYAIWSPVTYKITYELNGGKAENITEYSIETGEFSLNAPTRAGYTFTGWSGSNLTGENNMTVTITDGTYGDLSFVAHWQANENTLVFDANGGVGTMGSRKGRTGSTVRLNANTFTRKGYDFDGWSTEKGGKKQYSDGGFYKMGPDEVNILYAVWVPHLNDLVFNGNGSAFIFMEKMQLYTGQTHTLKKNTYRKQGYTFLGWSTTKDGAVEYLDEAEYVMGEEPSVTLYAVWQANEYTISMDPQNGDLSTSQKVVYNSPYKFFVPIRKGYKFDGWFTQKGGNDSRLTDSEGNSIQNWNKVGNITIYANWLGTDGILYTEKDTTYTVSGVSDKTITEAYIPEYYNGKLVTTIGGNAFAGCNQLSDIFVQKTIQTIEKGAFSGCSALTRLVVPFVGESRTATQEKGLLTYWFGQESADNTEEILQSYLDSDEVYQTYSAYVPLSLTNIKVFDTMRIPYGAFSYMSKLQNVSFDGVSEIEERAFEYATGISTFDLPDTLKSIGANAFAHTSIKNITIPSSVQSIGEGVFAGCKALAEIKIPFVGQNAEATEYNAVLGWLFGQNNYDGMVATTQGSWTSYISAVLKTVEITNASTVPEYAFANIKTLKSVTLANTVTTIKDYAFRGCTGLTNIDLHLISTIGGSAFYECSGLTSVNLESATSIGSNAFFKAYSLESVDFSDNLTTIGGSAFYACKIGKIEIPNSIVSIGSSAFEANSVLRTIIIRKESAILPYSTDMLTGFNSYAKIYVPDGLLASYKSNSNWKALGVDKFYGLSIIKSNRMAISGNTLVQYFGTDESVTIPSSTTNILPYAFYRNSFVRRIVIPGTITTITDHAFYGCDNLETVKLMRGTTQISSYAFAENALLQSINLPDTLVNIGAYSFKNTALTNIVVPNSVTSIGAGAFQGCPLASITLPFVGASRTATKSGAVFGYIFGYKSVHDSSTTSYRQGHVDESFGSQPATTVWQYSEYVYCSTSYNTKYYYPTSYYYYIPSTLTNVIITDATVIPEEAFYNCANITNVTLNNGIKTIGANAFKNCTVLKSMSLPSSVAEVGRYAFYGCSNMANITLSNLTKICDGTFQGCSLLDGVVLPKTLTEIGNYAFSGCVGLTGITIPDTVTSIGQSAFSGCAGITELTLPNGLQTIGQEAFKNMQLQSIVVPNSVTSIGAGAFQGCPLKSITLPFVGGSRTISNTVTETTSSSYSGSAYLFGYIFGGNTDYTSSKNSAPSSTTGLTYQGQGSGYYTSNSNGYYKFYWTLYYIPSALKTVTITDATGISANAFYGCTMIESLTLNEGITTIYDKAFYNCTALKSMSLSSSVAEVGSYAFYGCSNMTSITLSNITDINDYTFSGCVGLAGITIPDTVTRIGQSAFSGCAGITELTLPNGLQTIGQEAFKNMQLQSIVVPSSVTSIGFGAFQGCPLESVTLPFVGGSRATSDSVESTLSSTYLGLQYLFGYIFGAETKNTGDYNAPNSTDGLIYQGQQYYYYYNSPRHYYYWTRYYIPATLKSVVITDATGISANAFYGCTMIESLTLNEGITTIYDKAFYNCKALKSMVLPSSVTEVGSYAFYGCSNMASIKLSNLTKISDYAFQGCSSLTGVTLPETLTEIGSNAFKGCSKLKIVEIANGNITDLTVLGSNVFSNTHSSLCIIVPQDALKAYKEAASWSSYASKIIADNNIVDNAFIVVDGVLKQYFGNAENITTPANITSIGNYAFAYSNVKNVTIGNDVTTIGQYAFAYCASLQTVTIDDSVTSIGDYAFYNCQKLETVAYGSGLSAIGNYAFAECSELSKINSTDNGVFNLNGNGLKNIGKMAFNNANKATKIIVGKSVEAIELGAFNGCNSLVSIELPFIGIDRSTAYSQSQVFGYIFGYETSNKEGTTTQYTNYYYYIPASLREVVITDETVISKNAFINCSMIESIIIKSDLTSIGDYAFYNCDGLNTLTIESNTMPTISAYVFNGDSTVVIKVNSAILSDYQSDANWSKRMLEAIVEGY